MHRPAPSTVVAALVPWLWFAARDLSAWMEVVAVILPAIGAAGLVVAGLTLFSDRVRLLRVLALSTVLMTAVAVGLPRLPVDEQGNSGDLTVVTANLTTDNRDAGSAVIRLMAEDPDVLVLEEANPHARRLYPNVMASLPYAYGSDDLSSAETVLFSRYPLTPLTIPAEVDTGRIVAAEVDGPIRFIVVGAHLPRPWFESNEAERLPAARHDLIEGTADWLGGLEGPVILAGDLNSNDRGLDYRLLLHAGSLVDSIRVHWAATTSTKWWPLLLRIDHVLVRGFCPVSATNTPLPGSDHRSVVAHLQYCA
jgi:endonuclease/exonuclease/phosphatase (EEP) superfamily protein YafD